MVMRQSNGGLGKPIQNKHKTLLVVI